MARLVLVDASPIIGLTRVNGLGWLGQLFSNVWVPQEVRREVLSGRGGDDELQILEAERCGYISLWPESAPTQPKLPDLDEGEAACIRIALQQKVASLILIDDRMGRVVAREHGLKVAGTAAVIGMAKLKGLITSARVVFEELHSSDFRISAEVIREVLDRVQE